MMGGARRVGTMAVVVALIVVAASGLARAEGPAGARKSSYVLLHDGGSLTLALLAATGAEPGAHIWNGRHNSAAQGFAIVSEADGGLLVVRYETRGDVTRYTIRQVDADGNLRWVRRVDASATTHARREIAVAAHAAVPAVTVR